MSHRGNNPFYWIHVTLGVLRAHARRHPVTAAAAPVVACSLLGALSLRLTNPVAADDMQASLAGQSAGGGTGVAGQGPAEQRWSQGDPYAPRPAAPAKVHKTWQAQYVQNMLDGLQHKSREEKLDDAFEALDKFMKPCND